MWDDFFGVLSLKSAGVGWSGKVGHCWTKQDIGEVGWEEEGKLDGFGEAQYFLEILHLEPQGKVNIRFKPDN